MFQKQRRQLFGSFGHGQTGRMICVGAARTVTKQNRRKRTRPVWFPKESFKTQLPAGNNDCFRNNGVCLANNERHRKWRKQESQRFDSQELPRNVWLLRDANVFRFGKESQRFFAAFATDAALFHASKRNAQVAY